MTRTNRSRWSVVAAGAVLAGLAGVTATVAAAPPWLDRTGTAGLIAAGWLLFAAGVLVLRRVPVRAAVVLIVLGGVGLPLLAAAGPPSSSDDLYRYQWDGQVQAAGTDPYRYAPADAALVPLRDGDLWPPDAGYCVPDGAVDAATGRPLAPGCTRINRPAVHTIYPPVAEAYFLVVHYLAPPGAGHAALQVAAALCAAAVTCLLIAGLRRLRADPRRAALWAWCPTVALEAGNNAHVDVLAALITVAALVLLAGGRRAAPGAALLGLAVAAKVTPALVLPAVLRRRPVAVLVAAAGAVVAVYLPHVLAVGGGVLGYLPGYLGEEGYRSGRRFALLSLVLPQSWAGPVAVVVLAAVAVAVLRLADPDRPWRGAVVMTGAALLVTTPAYPWYALLLVALVALDGRAEWLTLAAAGYLALYARDIGLAGTPGQRLGYGAALFAILAVAAYRRAGLRVLSYWRSTLSLCRS